MKRLNGQDEVEKHWEALCWWKRRRGALSYRTIESVPRQTLTEQSELCGGKHPGDGYNSDKLPAFQLMGNLCIKHMKQQYSGRFKETREDPEKHMKQQPSMRFKGTREDPEKDMKQQYSERFKGGGGQNPEIEKNPMDIFCGSRRICCFRNAPELFGCFLMVFRPSVWPVMSAFWILSQFSFYETVTADSCLGGLAVMTLARNARNRGSIPHWFTEFFGLSEPTVTFGAQLWDSMIYLYGQSVRTCFPQRGWMWQWTVALVV